MSATQQFHPLARLCPVTLVCRIAFIARSDVCPTAPAAKKQHRSWVGLLVYSIADVLGHRFEVYTDPTGPAQQPDYRQHQEYGPANEIPVVLDGEEIGRLLVRELLP